MTTRPPPRAGPPGWRVRGATLLEMLVAVGLSCVLLATLAVALPQVTRTEARTLGDLGERQSVEAAFEQLGADLDHAVALPDLDSFRAAGARAGPPDPACPEWEALAFLALEACPCDGAPRLVRICYRLVLGHGPGQEPADGVWSLQRVRTAERTLPRELSGLVHECQGAGHAEDAPCQTRVSGLLPPPSGSLQAGAGPRGADIVVATLRGGEFTRGPVGQADLVHEVTDAYVFGFELMSGRASLPSTRFVHLRGGSPRPVREGLYGVQARDVRRAGGDIGDDAVLLTSAPGNARGVRFRWVALPSALHVTLELRDGRPEGPRRFERVLVRRATQDELARSLCEPGP